MLQAAMHIRNFAIYLTLLLCWFMKIAKIASCKNWRPSSCLHISNLDRTDCCCEYFRVTTFRGAETKWQCTMLSTFDSVRLYSIMLQSCMCVHGENTTKVRHCTPSQTVTNSWCGKQKPLKWKICCDMHTVASDSHHLKLIDIHWAIFQSELNCLGVPREAVKVSKCGLCVWDLSTSPHQDDTVGPAWGIGAVGVGGKMEEEEEGGSSKSESKGGW